MSSNTGRLLLVDDEVALLKTLQRLFESEGYDVTALADPAAALLELQRQEFSCLVTDNLMPRISGLELVKAARQKWPDMGIVVITGAPDLPSAVEALRMGANDYIVKPVFEKGIERVVERVVTETRLRGEVRRQNAELALLLRASEQLGQADYAWQVESACEVLALQGAEMHASKTCTLTLQNMARQASVRVTTRRLREQARLGALLDTHPAGILVLDEHGQPLVVSSRVAPLLGLGETGNGKPPELLATVVEQLRRIDEAGGVGDIRCDGGRRLLQVRTSRVQEGGAPAGIVASLLDVTEQRDRELQWLTNARISAIGEIVAGVCHQLNNPLTIILGVAEELQESGDLECADRGRRIEQAASRCAEFVRQLGPIVRRSREAAGPVDLHAAVRSVLEAMQGHFARNGIQVREQLDPVPEVSGLASEIREAVMALSVNAVDAMPSGGQLGVATRMDTDGRVLLEVSDTGAGIPHDVLPRIFDPFFTSKSSPLATGLGLAVVHAVCTRMGATISVQTQPGAGARFQIRFGTTLP